MNETDYYFLYSSSLVLSIVVSPICRMKNYYFIRKLERSSLLDLQHTWSRTTALVPQHGQICQLDQRLK